jgi:putative peptidoglycan lipid II flippase
MTPLPDRQGVRHALARAGVGVVGVALAVKLVDVAKNMLSVSRFGMSPQADVYNILLSLPDAVIVLIGLDTIRGAATTYFTEWMAVDNVGNVRRLLSGLVSWGLLISSLVAVAAIVTMPRIIAFLAPGFTGDKLQLAVTLGYVMIPALIVRPLVGVFVAALNAKGEFVGISALAVIPSVAVVIALIMVSANSLAAGISTAYVAGVVGYVIVLALVARSRVGWSFRFRPLPERFGDVIRFSGSLVVAMAAGQVASIVERRTASYFPDGTVATLAYANTVAGLIILLLVMSQFGVVQREVSSRLATEGLESAIALFWRYASHVLFAIVFCSIVLVVCRVPLLRVLYQRGAFDESAVQRTAAPLLIYGVWTVCQATGLMITALLLATKHSKPIVVANVAGFALNAFLVWPFSAQWGYVGIAVAALVGITTYAVILIIGARSALGPAFRPSNMRPLRIVAVGAVACLVCLVGLSLVPWVQQSGPLVTVAGRLSCMLVVVGGVYVGLSHLAGVNAVPALWRVLRMSLPGWAGGSR